MIFPSHRVLWIVICTSLAAFAQGSPKPSPSTITLSVDATQAPRKIFHAHLTIPATGGTLTLHYPKWMPGEHGPTGPIQDLTGLKFEAGGQALKWRRDLLDAWTFHVEVPVGVTSVEASLDFLSPAGEQGLYTGGPSATEKMAILSWNTVLLYPAGSASDQLTYQASLRLPEGWKFATSLPITSQSGAEIHFNPTSLTMLVDSPVQTGEYMRIIPLAENPHQELDLAADNSAALNAPDDVIEDYKKMTEQAKKLFGAQHFRDYHFLYSLSDHVEHFGLEHHESDDSRVGERGIIDSEQRLLNAGLLSHEYVHSWNGKYRRPADLATPDYTRPMLDDLLWVYEGLTSYLGDILGARSGLRTPEQFRNNVALIAAQLDHNTPGRTWRNLQDTADGVPAMQGAPRQWESWRRDLDYYDEDVLNWLWVDTIIRQQSHNKKSIDDFCHLFHGGQSGPPEVKPYTFDDVVNALNQVVAYDWRGFWNERLTNHGPGAPLTGIENSGWKLVYTDHPSELSWTMEDVHEGLDATFSLGLQLMDDGSIVDTIEGSPAAQAGVGPGMKLIAVNGEHFTPNLMRDTLRTGVNSSAPIELLVENAGYYKVYKVDYHGGEKYHHLERDESKPDMLGEIITAR
jgi:predicted metalloprotease with PDZ domain